MKTFRPAAASIFWGAENLTCVFLLVPKSCFFLCVFFSSFYTFSPVCFSFVTFLIFTSGLRFCLCLGLLLFLVFLLHDVFFARCQCQNECKNSMEQHIISAHHITLTIAGAHPSLTCREEFKCFLQPFVITSYQHIISSHHRFRVCSRDFLGFMFGFEV